MFLLVLRSARVCIWLIGECSRVDCISYVDSVLSLDMLMEIEAQRRWLYTQRMRCALLEWRITKVLHIRSSVNLCLGTRCQVGTSATAGGRVKGVCAFVCSLLCMRSGCVCISACEWVLCCEDCWIVAGVPASSQTHAPKDDCS